MPIPKYSAYVIFTFLCNMLANFDWKNWNRMQWSTFSRESMHSLPYFLHTFMITYICSISCNSISPQIPPDIIYSKVPPNNLGTLQTSPQTEKQRRDPEWIVWSRLFVKFHSLQSERVIIMEQKLGLFSGSLQCHPISYTPTDQAPQSRTEVHSPVPCGHSRDT